MSNSDSSDKKTNDRLSLYLSEPPANYNPITPMNKVCFLSYVC